METKDLIKDLQQCSGCGVCASVCHTNAITMREDSMGFAYPDINSAMCVSCGKCVEMCPYGKEAGVEPLEAYAAVNRQQELTEASTSGGVFAALAHSCANDESAVVGAVMDCGEFVNVYHLLSHSPADIYLMQGSKYVQSDVSACFDAVLASLTNGETVFFTGTPCQVAAIKRLTGDPDNLITADLLCHGVPSRKMLSDFLALLSRRLGGKVVDMKFRDRHYNHPFTATFHLNKGFRIRAYRISNRYLSYYQNWREGMIFRESCYSCPYASTKRVGDLTMGDFWGVDKYFAREMRGGQMDRRALWSCLLVNTEKGREFLKKNGSKLQLQPAKVSWIALENQSLNIPVSKPEGRQELIDTYREKGYPGVEKMFLKERGGILRFYWRIWQHIRRNRIK